MTNVTDYVFVDEEACMVCNLIVNTERQLALYIPFEYEEGFRDGGYIMNLNMARAKYKELQRLWGNPQAVSQN
jgi:hypothetical protein